MPAQESAPTLALNSGSASLAFAVYPPAADAPAQVRGNASGVGIGGGRLRIRGSDEQPILDEPRAFADHEAAYGAVFDWLAAREGRIGAIGHRIVHGGTDRFEPEPLDEALLNALRELIPWAPSHLPQAILGVERAREAYPDAVQVAVYDTHFHRDLPKVAQLLPLPRRYWTRGLRRVGFHGLSYEHVLQTLRRDYASVAHGRLVLVHLGGGASMAAVSGGRCLDTTMGLTPAGGLVMSTRSGDLDPGVLTHLLQADDLTADDLRRLVHEESGLMGVSGGRSGDVQGLLDAGGDDEAAADAVGVYVHHARKHLGALVAVLGGLDALAFTGSVGTGAPEVRARIGDGFDFLGLRLDPARNRGGGPRISADDSDVLMLALASDEEAIIAQHVREVLDV